MNPTVKSYHCRLPSWDPGSLVNYLSYTSSILEVKTDGKSDPKIVDFTGSPVCH